MPKGEISPIKVRPYQGCYRYSVLNKKRYWTNTKDLEKYEGSKTSIENVNLSDKKQRNQKMLTIVPST